MEKTITTFLTFSGNAEEAMHFYVSTFPNSEITSVRYISEEDRGEFGELLNGSFVLKGQKFMAMDMEAVNCPEFTWAMSFYVDCHDESEFDQLFSKLSEKGKVLRKPKPMIQFRKVAWITDQFNITWQLVWE